MLIWVKEKQLAGDSLSEAVICEKSKMPHADFLKVIPLRLVGDDSINLRSVCRLNSRHVLYIRKFKRGNHLGVWKGLIPFTLFLMEKK